MDWQKIVDQFFHFAQLAALLVVGLVLFHWGGRDDGKWVLGAALGLATADLSRRAIPAMAKVPPAIFLLVGLGLAASACSTVSAEVVKLDQVVAAARPRAKSCEVSGSAVVAVAEGVAAEFGAQDVVGAVGRLVVLGFCEVYAVVQQLRQRGPVAPVAAATLRSALERKTNALPIGPGP